MTTQQVSLNSGMTLTAAAGVYEEASILMCLWDDSNGDGVWQTSREFGIPFVTLQVNGNGLLQGLCEYLECLRVGLIYNVETTDSK